MPKEKKEGSSRDKTKVKDDDKEKDRSKDKTTSKSGSSRSKDKKASSSSSSRSKDKDRDRDKEKDKEKDRDKDADKDASRKRSSSRSSRTREGDASSSKGGGAEDGGKEAQRVSSNPDFEAGLMFERYAHGKQGAMDAQDFQRMWRERTEQAARKDAKQPSAPLPPESLFDVGKLFERYNSGKDGKLSYDDFLRLVREEEYNFSDKKQPRQQQQQQQGAPAPVSAVGGATSSSGGGGGGGGMVTGGPATQQGDSNAYSYSGVRVGPPLTHYNETTGIPVPQDAVSAQLSLGHTVVPLGEAFERRVIRLQAMVASRLMPAREALLQLRRRLQNMSEEVKMTCAAVERETMADTNAILERLRSADALKQATIAQKVGDVTAELRSIDKIAERVASVVEGGGQVIGGEKLFGGVGDAVVGAYVSPANRYRHELIGADRMVELIQSYGQLCSAIDKAGDKPVDNSTYLDIDVVPDDFPRETAERLEVLRRADRYEKVLAVKDQLVWDLLQDNKRLEEQCKTEARLGRDYAAETGKWVELTNRLTAELNTAKEHAATVPLLREEIARLHEEKRLLAAKVERHIARTAHSPQPPAVSTAGRAG